MARNEMMSLLNRRIGFTLNNSTVSFQSKDWEEKIEGVIMRFQYSANPPD